jgi:hypothetical protein
VLAIPAIKQKQSEWCWVICAIMVLHYYKNHGVKKCDLVNFLFHQTNCCTNPDSPECNKPCKWTDIKKVYSHWNITGKLNKGSIAFSIFIIEINAGRPVQIGYEWAGGNGHVALVTGYKTEGIKKFIYINDPLHGNGWQLYNDVKKKLLIREWKYTWILIKPK